MLEEPASVQGGPKLKSHLISTLIVLLVLFPPTPSITKKSLTENNGDSIIMN